MNKERGLAWILSGLTLATAAAAMTMVIARRQVPAWLPSSAGAAQIAAEPASLPLNAAPVALPATASLAPPSPDTAQASATEGPTFQPPDQTQVAATEPPADSGQIWECTTNGIKTFSGNPCGEKSTLLEVRAINTMNPAPDAHYARAYADPHYADPHYADPRYADPRYADPRYADPRYAPRYTDSNAYGDPNGYDQDSPPDQINGDYNGGYAGNSYVIVPGYAFLPHRRPEHPHRPDSHHNSAPVRKN